MSAGELIEKSKMEKNIMLHKISNFFQMEYKRNGRFAISAGFALSLGCASAPVFVQESVQRSFASNEAASRPLLEALRAKDEQAPLNILSLAGKDVMSSGRSDAD